MYHLRFLMPSEISSRTRFLPSLARSSILPSMVFSCLRRKGRTTELQHLRERSESGWRRRTVTAMRKIMQKNLLKKRRRKGVVTSAREKMIQQLRQRMSSSLSVLSKARKDRQAGTKQHTTLVSSDCVPKSGLSSSRIKKIPMAARLGFTLYFSSTKLSAGNLSRTLSCSGSTSLLTSDIINIIISLQRHDASQANPNPAFWQWALLTSFAFKQGYFPLFHPRSHQKTHDTQSSQEHRILTIPSPPNINYPSSTLMTIVVGIPTL